MPRFIGTHLSAQRDEVFIQPTIFASDERFKQALPAAQTLISGEIDLTLAEGTVSAGKVGKDLLVSWLTLDPESLMPTLDQAAVAAWAEQKGVELNTIGTKRTFKRPDGKNVTVSGGVYGWKVSTADLASTLIETLLQGTSSDAIFPVSRLLMCTTDLVDNDWTAYVDIDLSEQGALLQRKG